MMGTEVSHIPWLGFVVLSIVVGSLSLIILAAILGKPRKPKVTMVFVGMIFTLLAIFIVGIWLGASVFGLFIP